MLALGLVPRVADLLARSGEQERPLAVRRVSGALPDSAGGVADYAHAARPADGAADDIRTRTCRLGERVLTGVAKFLRELTESAEQSSVDQHEREFWPMRSDRGSAAANGAHRRV
jgi:hypothetical protein